MNIRKSILLRARLAFLLTFIFGVAVLVKLSLIQFVDGEKWTKIADDIGLKFIKVKATRGNIYSDNGSLLATSLPFYRVAFDPSRADEELYAKKIDSLSYLLEDFFGERSANAYKRKIHDARLSGRQYMFLSRSLIHYQEMKQLSQWPIFREGRNKGGIIFEKVDRRFKPFSSLGYRTIGFINENGIGAGLEYSFNKSLAGKDGEALYQKIAGGNWKPVHDDTEIRPTDGYDIQTTLDVNLQDVAESALLKALQEHQADYGCVVVMEVKTGEIKAMSNLSRTSSGKYWEKYNYAVGSQGLTEPGSTFKLASIMALLEETNLQITDSIDTGDGEYRFYDRTMPDHKPGGFGKLSVEEAFAYSSNIAISKMVNTQFGHNPQRFVDYIKALGIGQPLGFQLIGEGIPYVKDTSDNTWSGVTLPWMSIGHELLLTPLQTLAFYNAVANDGKMIQPILVRKVKKADKAIKAYQSVILNKKICSDETLIKVRRLLESVVAYGTASNINDSGYPIAGKTGTAQKIKDGRYTRKYYTSFAGYFPANKPLYSAIVVIDEPKGYRQYGSDVAAPVFKEIADKIYSLNINMHDPIPEKPVPPKGIFPVIQAGYKADLNYICQFIDIRFKDQAEEEWVRTKINNDTVEWTPAGIKTNVVPDVRGMTLRDAIYLLENNGLRVIYEGKGRVSDQSQEPGLKALKGSIVKIKLNEV